MLHSPINLRVAYRVEVHCAQATSQQEPDLVFYLKGSPAKVKKPKELKPAKKLAKPTETKKKRHRARRWAQVEQDKGQSSRGGEGCEETLRGG